MALRSLSICAGVGGIDLGLRLALGGDIRTVCFVERDSYAASLLVARMEEAAMDRAPVWDDVCTFDGAAWRGCVDIVAAGIPCQPYSDAGNKLGEHDERDLLEEFVRVVGEVGPRYAFVENVAGFTALGLGRLLGGFADRGFDAEWGMFSAQGVGAPHRRRRMFILAERAPDASGDAVRVEPERGTGWAQAADERDAEHGDLGEAVEARKAMAERPRGGRGELRQPPGVDRLSDRDNPDVADSARDDRRAGERGEEEGTRPNEERGRGPSGGKRSRGRRRQPGTRRRAALRGIRRTTTTRGPR